MKTGVSDFRYFISFKEYKQSPRTTKKAWKKSSRYKGTEVNILMKNIRKSSPGIGNFRNVRGISEGFTEAPKESWLISSYNPHSGFDIML